TKPSSSQEGGMILQRITITAKVTFAHGPNKGKAFSTPQLLGIDQSWWEAWPVGPREKGSLSQSNPFTNQQVAGVYAADDIQNPDVEANDWWYMFAAGRDQKGGNSKGNRDNT